MLCIHSFVLMICATIFSCKNTVFVSKYICWNSKGAKVQGINALVSYEGRNVEELLKDFHDAVDDYLLFCEQTNADPEIAYKGSFNIRIKPALHERLAIIAMNQGKALNNCAQEAIENYVNQFK